MPIDFLASRLTITTLTTDRGWVDSVPPGDDPLVHRGVSFGGMGVGPEADRYGWVIADQSEHVLVGMEVW